MHEFDRHELYELCVQNPPLLADLLEAIYADGQTPSAPATPAVRSRLALAEDFCGSAALAREWVRRSPARKAIAVDLDPAPLRRAKALNPAPRRLKLLRGDALADPRLLRPAATADVLFVGNFSIGEIHSRPALVRYLRRCRSRIRPRGVFVCDTYAGATAFTRGSVQRLHTGPDRAPACKVRYTWQQRAADPLTAHVENAIHFRVETTDDRGRREVTHELTDAFVYRWRLWSPAELRDAMIQAGLADVRVYQQLPDARDADGLPYAQPVQSPDELDDSFIVCVAGRVAQPVRPRPRDRGSASSPSSPLPSPLSSPSLSPPRRSSRSSRRAPIRRSR